MWYFTWVLGVGLVVAFGIINVMWLEATYAFGIHDEEQMRKRFEQARRLNRDAWLWRHQEEKREK